MGTYSQIAKPQRPPQETKRDEPTRDTTVPRQRDSKQSSSQAVKQASNHDGVIEAIRAAVRDYGKEQTTHRLTTEEKKALMDIVYSYKRMDTVTSENEVVRIAINFIIEDYRRDGKHSILERVLRALNR